MNLDPNRLNSVSTDMNPCHQRNAVRRALRIYSEKFELDFTEITDPAAKVDIDIMFSTGKSSQREESVPLVAKLLLI